MGCPEELSQLYAALEAGDHKLAEKIYLQCEADAKRLLPAVKEVPFAVRNRFEQAVFRRDYPQREKPPLYRNHERGHASTYLDPAVELE